MPADYVPAAPVRRVGRQGPDPRGWSSKMIEKGWAGQEEIDAALRRAFASEVDEAVEWAEKSPYPDPARCWTTSTRAGT